MSDDLNWDDDEFEATDLVTVGQQKVAEELKQKFEGEDEEIERAKKPTPPPQQQPQTKEKSKYEDKGKVAPIEEPLDDPVAEKLRLQKRQEESDFRHTVEMFGGGDNVTKLEGFVPVSASDFEDNHYKALLKHLFKEAVSSLSSSEIKDLENCLASVRFEKQRIEKVEKENANKRSKKATLVVEKSSMSAGLDDDIYDLDDDDEGFM